MTPQLDTPEFRAHLQQRFGVTRAELNVLLLVAEGHPIKRCAEILQRSPNTIKAQRKGITKRLKLRFHSAEVLALVWREYVEFDRMGRVAA